MWTECPMDNISWGRRSSMGQGEGQTCFCFCLSFSENERPLVCVAALWSHIWRTGMFRPRKYWKWLNVKSLSSTHDCWGSVGHPSLLPRLSQASFYDLSTLPARRQAEEWQGHISGSGYIQILGSWVFQALNQNWLSPLGLLCLFPMCAPVWIQGDALLLGWVFSLPTAEHAQTSSWGLLVSEGNCAKSAHWQHSHSLSWDSRGTNGSVSLTRDWWQGPLCQPTYLNSIWTPALCASLLQELFFKALPITVFKV